MQKNKKKMITLTNFLFFITRVISVSESGHPQKSTISILCDSDIIWVSYAILKEHLERHLGVQNEVLSASYDTSL